jgi:hypothetical protein
MPARKLNRVAHRDPLLPSQPPRSGSPSHGETAVDVDEYVRPLQEVHGGDAHDWGILSGLGVKAVLNQPGVRVLTGAALDIAGRTISLAQGATAEVGANPPVDPATPDTSVPIDGDGALVPSTGLTGPRYVTISWREAFDVDAYNATGGMVYRFNHMPWLRLVPTAGFVDDGSQIVLARAQLDGAGNVTGLTHEKRRNAGAPVETLRLRKGRTAAGSPNFSVDTTGAGAGNPDSGLIRPREAGGIEVRVPAAGDQIVFERDGGSFARMLVAASALAVRRNDGRETVTVDSEDGNLNLGTTGVDGDLFVRDMNNRPAITADGGSATVTIGVAGNEGDLRVKDDRGYDSFRVDGATGTAFTRRLAPSSGHAVDADTRFFHIHGWDLCLDGRSGGNKRALVDANNRLVVNFAGDYANGVTVENLHLWDHHVKGYFWEIHDLWNPGNNVWHVFFEMDTGLPSSQWTAISCCEIGMFDRGTVENFWWGTVNTSFVNDAGNIVVQWQVYFNDTGPDFMPWNRQVMWLAFRR